MAKYKLALFSFFLIACGLAFAPAADAQSISGIVINNSEWLNDTTVVPEHWPVQPDLGTVSNAHGRVLVALYDLSDANDPKLTDVLPLSPTNLLDLVDLSTVQGSNWGYLLGNELAAGEYQVIGWIDGNGNWLPDEGEPFGARDVTVSEDSSVNNIIVQIEDDTDSDGMEDWWEAHWFKKWEDSAWIPDLSQTAGKDYDNDGLTNIEEYNLINSGMYVEPNNWDTDGDGMDDAWERFYNKIDPTVLDPTSATGDDGPDEDPDADTISNYIEYIGPDGIGWRRFGHTDAPGSSIAEFTTSKDAMNPISVDSDLDGVDDNDEFLQDLTHPVHSMSGANFYPRSLEMSVNGSAGVTLTDPAGDLYDFGNDGGTVEFWIRPDTDGNGVIYEFNSALPGDHFIISLEDYRPKMEIFSGADLMATVGGTNDSSGSAQQLEANMWTHVACVIAPENNSLNIYIDGILLIASKTFYPANLTGGIPVICQGFADGYIDELRIWNYPRPTADIEYWSKRIYPAPGYVQKSFRRKLDIGTEESMYKYSNPHPLLGYFRFDDGGSRVENFAFINYGLYPNATEYYLPLVATAAVTTNQAVPMLGSDDADADGIPEWWVELHNLEQYPEYYTSAYGPIAVPVPDDLTKLFGFEYYRSFIGYGSVGTDKYWQEDGGVVYHDPKTRPDFYDGDNSSFTRYAYLFAQPVECPLEIFTPGMSSTIIYINGTQITTVGDEANTMQSYDIAQYMHVGRNMIHVECESFMEDNHVSFPYGIEDYWAYNSGWSGHPMGADDEPYKFKVAVGKFDARLNCNGVAEIVRGDESRADPRSVWHCQVWSSLYGDISDVPEPDREFRSLPENADYGLPLNAERDNNPLDPDSADDSLDAVYEYICGTNPRDRDSNNNGVSDGDEDFDDDGLLNREEQRFGSDPWLADSDDDGLIDGLDIGSNGHPAQSLSPQNNLGIRFGGAQTDFLSFPKEQRFELSKWTIEAWVKPDVDENDGGIILQRSVASNAVNYEIGLTAADIPYVSYVSIDGTEVKVDGLVAVAGDGATWTHVAASYYDRDLVLYVNGTNVASTTGPAFPSVYAGGPIVQNIGCGFKGCIDELRLWGDNRSATEIINNRDEVLTGLESTLVAYYRFDDGTSYTNLPPVVGTSANNGTNGAASTTAWTWGQVEDNVLKYSSDWQYQWSHAASFNGDVGFTTDHIITGPPRLQVFIQTDDAVDAGGLWSHNGGAAWNDSGYLETRLSAGGYDINFKEIDGWVTPSLTNVTLVRGESTIITGRYMQTAAITVIIDNNSDVKSYATWSLDGGITRQGTGTKIEGLEPGVGYDIIFSDISAEVPGWDRPTTIQDVVLLEGEERTITASYTPVMAMLQINFTPDDAPSAGRWRVSGDTNWYGTGAIVTNLSYGEHDIEYNSVAWWQEPNDEIISLEDSNLVSEDREWTKLSEPSAIITIINPSAAITAGAVWQMNGATYNSGESVTVDSGDYTVIFNDVDGWLTPMDIATSVSGSTTITGTYYQVDIIGGDRDGDLNSPRGIAATLRYLYITDSDNHRIQIYDRDTGGWTSLGEYGSGLGQFDRPFGIVVDDNGDLWIADTGNHRIQRYAATTGIWTSFGSYGVGSGQFNAPYDLDLDSNGNLYVADYHNSRIQKCTAAGVWSVIVASGIEEARVRHPSGVTVDANNDIYVSDYDPTGAGQAGRIQKFDSTGALLEELGGELEGAGGLNQNMGLSVGSDGQLFAANTFDNEVLVLNTNGVWETVIAVGVLNRPRDVQVDSLGNVIIADTENNRVIIIPSTNTVSNPGVAARNDFDGDGQSDLGLYYAPSGNWYIYKSRDGFYSTAFGFEGTVPISGDFDGDGISDFGCYYAPGGNWYMFTSTDGFKEKQFGYAGTIPITGDFDADGIDDIGCYYPAGGNWYIFKSTDGFFSTVFGFADTVPITGDFDGDGVSDFGCYYAPGGNWYMFTSTDGFKEKQFGYAGTIPFTGDFDADGIDDIGCYYPAGGNWYIFKSRDGFFSTTFGYDGTAPVSGDFDGDGICDFGCYYPAGGNWYIFSSSKGFYQELFGFSGTVPLGGTQIQP